MIKFISAVLTEPQRQALLASKLFNGIDYMSIRCTNGHEVNSFDEPVTIERGRCQCVTPYSSYRKNFIRSNMGGWAELEIFQEDRRKWNKSEPINFMADFGLVGSIEAAHELLLSLKECGLIVVTVNFAGCNYGSLREIYELMGYKPNDFCSNVPEILPITQLLSLCATLKQRQIIAYARYKSEYTLDEHLIGITNIIPS